MPVSVGDMEKKIKTWRYRCVSTPLNILDFFLHRTLPASYSNTVHNSRS